MALKKCKDCGSEVSKKAKSCPKCGSPQKPSTSKFTWVVGGLFAIVVLNMVFSSGGDHEASTTTTTTTKTERPPAAYKAVTLENVSFSLESNVFLLNTLVKNDNQFPVGDILVRCTTYGQTNTALSRLDYTVRQIVAAGESLELSQLNMGFADSQSSRASCRVVAVNTVK